MSQAAASPQPPSEIDLRDQRGMLGGPGSETSTSGDRTEEEKKQDAERRKRARRVRPELAGIDAKYGSLP